MNRKATYFRRRIEGAILFQPGKWFRKRRRRADSSPLRSAPLGQFVFVHINKTGGTSIGKAVHIPCKQHLTVREIIATIGRTAWRSAFTFAFVRNPWSRVVSQYNHRIRTNQTSLADRPIPFHEWVSKTYGPDRSSQYLDSPKMFQPQVEWLRDDQGQIKLDFIGRFEVLQASFGPIAERLGFDPELPHLNAGTPCDFRAYYDDRTAEWIGNWFAEDCREFGYCFDRAEPLERCRLSLAAPPTRQRNPFNFAGLGEFRPMLPKC